MDVNELNHLSAQLLERAFVEGVQAGRLDCLQIIGLLELRKSEVLSVMQLKARQQALAELRAKHPLIVPPGMNGRG